MSFHVLEKLSQLYDGYRKEFRVSGRSLLLLQDEGRVYLIENRCPHMDAPLTHSTVSHGKLRCPIHGIEFVLSTGAACGPLMGTLDSLVSFPIVYEGNTLGVDI